MYSRLYQLKPIGIGSTYTESLTGYISRLAQAHCVSVGTLMAAEFAPLLKKEYLLQEKEGVRFYRGSFTLNGLGSGAGDFIRATEELTQNKNLQYLTMLPWAGVLPGRGLLRQTKAWCPVCYDEWMAADKNIYEPLIWAVKAVTVCPHHKVLLNSTCHNCKNTIPLLGRQSRPGYCSKCGSWLGLAYGKNFNSYDTTDDEIESNIWVALNVDEMISSSPSMEAIPLYIRVVEIIRLIVDKLFNGNVASFAYYLCVPKTTAWGWYKEKNKPSIEMLLKMSFSFNINLYEFLTGNLTKNICKIADKTNNYNFRGAKTVRKPLNIEKLQINMEKIFYCTEEAPLSVQEVARRLGVNSRNLYNHFPDLCRLISSRYMAAVKGEREKKLFKNSCTVKSIIESLRNEGIYPSRRLVQKCAAAQGVYWEKEIQAIWSEALSRVDICQY